MSADRSPTANYVLKLTAMTGRQAKKWKESVKKLSTSANFAIDLCGLCVKPLKNFSS